MGWEVKRDGEGVGGVGVVAVIGVGVAVLSILYVLIDKLKKVLITI